jgi:hypothetical protein
MNVGVSRTTLFKDNRPRRGPEAVVDLESSRSNVHDLSIESPAVAIAKEVYFRWQYQFRVIAVQGRTVKVHRLNLIHI